MCSTWTGRLGEVESWGTWNQSGTNRAPNDYFKKSQSLLEKPRGEGLSGCGRTLTDL